MLRIEHNLVRQTISRNFCCLQDVIYLRIRLLQYQILESLNLRKSRRSLLMRSSKWAVICIHGPIWTHHAWLTSTFLTTLIVVWKDLGLISILLFANCCTGTGEPGRANQMYYTRLGVYSRQACCCLSHLQMPPSLEVIWSWKNYCIRPYNSNYSFSDRGWYLDLFDILLSTNIVFICIILCPSLSYEVGFRWCSFFYDEISITTWC